MTKKTDDVTTSKVKTSVPFELTDRDLSVKGKEAATLNKQLKGLVVGKKNTVDEFNVKIKDRQARIDTLLASIKEGKEHRVVEATVKKFYTTNLVEFWFKGKLVHTRAMTVSERQVNLDEKKTFPRPKRKTTAQPQQALQ